MFALRSLPFLFALAVVADGWLGVYLVDAAHAEVREVIPGSPAAKAGLQKGDRFLAVDDKPVTTRQAFFDAIRACAPGQRVRLKIARGDREMVVEADLAQRPEPGAGTPPPAVEPRPDRPPVPPGEPGAPPRPFLGLGLSEQDGGVVVTRVIELGPGAQAGLRVEDRIVRLDDVEVRSLADVERVLAAHRPGDKVAVQVRRQDGTHSLMLVLGTAPAAPAPPFPPAPVPPPGGPAFGEDLEAAIARSEQGGRPVLVLYGAPWNQNSQAQRRALQDPGLRELLAGFELVFVDVDRQGRLAEQRRVQELPTLEVLQGRQTRVRHTGYLPAERLRAWLSGMGGTPPPGTAPPPVVPAEELAALRRELEELRREVQELRRLLGERRD